MSEATAEQLQSVLSLYMKIAGEPLPEDVQQTTPVPANVLKPMASLAAQSLTRILTKRKFHEPESDQ
jgi:hypothetical protein